jgi:hypothetical protein
LAEITNIPVFTTVLAALSATSWCWGPHLEHDGDERARAGGRFSGFSRAAAAVGAGVAGLTPHTGGKNAAHTGWVPVSKSYSTDRVDGEDAARDAHAEMWRGEFAPPWEWRKGKR